jgi:hypothetical protein
MLTLLANIPMHFTDWPLAVIPPLAQSGGPSPSFSWAIVLFFTILGLLVTLSPARRTSEVKRPKDE